MIHKNFPSNSTVLLKVDYNISSLTDTFRILMTKETVDQLLMQNNKILLLTHYGRPKKSELELSTSNLIEVISIILGNKTEYINQYENFELAKQTIDTSKSKIFILENTRYSEFESSEDKIQMKNLAKEYSSLGSFFVDEAFSVSHREEVTNTTIKEFLPNTLGQRYKIELLNLNKLKSPSKPFYLYMGGAKVETKLPLIRTLLERADKVFIGGMICFTFLRAFEKLGNNIPPLFDSYVDETVLNEVCETLIKYKSKIVLPIDLVYKSVEGKVQAGDIGSLTCNIFCNSIDEAHTIFWNGAFGEVEVPNLDFSTKSFIKKLVQPNDCFIIVGGGDTESILTQNQKSKLDFVSTGGGATLDYISKL
jgi:phosphoglycerate kinase